jgi:DtxR family Mn-dependent transcriptional regulator
MVMVTIPLIIIGVIALFALYILRNSVYLVRQSEAIVIGVADGSPSFLRYLDKHQIKLGTKLIIKEKFEFDNSMEVELNATVLSLSSAASSKITVQLL